MNVKEKYNIIQYNSYYSKKFYDADETIDFFDINLCKLLSEKAISNDISNLSEHFNFSKIFINAETKINELQIIILEFLILNNVKNISILLDPIDRNTKLKFLKKFYLKYKLNKKHLLGQILINLNEIDTLSFVSLINEEIDEDQIAYSITNLYNNKKDSVLKQLLLNNYRFKEILVTRVNPPFYYEIIENLNLSDEFINYRMDYIKNIINNIEKYDASVKKDVISEYYFKDIYSNMMIDIESIKSSFESLHFSIDISKEKLLITEFYNFFSNIDILTDEQIKDNLIKFDINKKLINSLLNFCQEQFKNEVSFKINQSSKDNPDFYVLSSDNKSVPIYDFENESGNEEFYILLSSIPCGDSAEEFKATYCSINNGELRYKRRSCSLINQSKLNCIFGGKNRICFGYTNLYDREITSATMTDGQTDGNETRYRKIRKTRGFKFIDPKEFVQNTSGHNEISMTQDGEYNIIMPSYLIVIGKDPSQLEIDIASSFNIPIRKINPLKYDQAEGPKQIIYEKQYDYFNFIRKTIKEKENIQTNELMDNSSIITK